MFYVLVLLIVLATVIQGKHIDRENLHPKPIPINPGQQSIDSNEKSANFWYDISTEGLDQRLAQQLNTNVAKNVIVFLGDGMSVATIAAARNYLQGESANLAFDRFPHTGLSKTYCVDHQVGDSACTATAYLCGVKANLATIGVNANLEFGDCAGMKNQPENYVKSIAYYAQKVGKRTGFVTTTRVTHASPSGLYAHTTNRYWESDTDILASGQDPNQCTDIGRQLVRSEVGGKFNVVLGGGRGYLLPNTTVDEEGFEGIRSDGLNLIDEWLQSKSGRKAKYVWNRQDLLETYANHTDYLLGLFESSHCKYNLERDPQMDPSLSEMTEKAIELLSPSSKGYFLFVEGGKIDIAHHEAKAQKALDETVEFSKAIERTLKLVDPKDTLIVVTADHAHTLTMSGYPVRGNDILGVANVANDKLPYLTLNYANGPGYVPEIDGQRHNVSTDDTHDLNYRFPGAFPLSSETHGGEDVLVAAEGPWAHLFTGAMEQTLIPRIISYAACLPNYSKTACKP